MRKIKYKAYLKAENKITKRIRGIKFYNGKIDIIVGNKGTRRTYNEGTFELIQSTGLFDSNGREIFDLDYVEYKGSLYIITFSKFSLCLKNIAQQTQLKLTNKILSNLVIKGNYYEN